MVAIDTFRFTTTDQAALDTIASIYGGTVRPWHDERATPKDQFEVITDANSIRIVLPPGALSTWYEKWTGGGCERRCDGVECWDRSKPIQKIVPCICDAQQNMQCKPYTRVNCILPEIRFAGVWRLESKGWNAAKEIAAMEQILSGVQEATGSPIIARLTIDKRSKKERGEVSHYVVPQLEFEHSVTELVSGGARATAAALGVATPPVKALAPASSHTLDDEVVEAEIVEEEDVRAKEEADRILAKLKIEDNKSHVALMEGAAELIRRWNFMGPDDDACLNRLSTWASKGEWPEWAGAPDDLLEKLRKVVGDLISGVADIRQLEGDAIRIVRRSA